MRAFDVTSVISVKPSASRDASYASYNIAYMGQNLCYLFGDDYHPTVVFQ